MIRVKGVRANENRGKGQLGLGTISHGVVGRGVWHCFGIAIVRERCMEGIGFWAGKLVNGWLGLGKVWGFHRFNPWGFEELTPGSSVLAEIVDTGTWEVGVRVLVLFRRSVAHGRGCEGEGVLGGKGS
nr:hypothetical protein [Tanacetum cinerariifolium]